MGDTVGSLTQEQNSIIVGSLLGDGYLRIVPGRKNAFLEINHCYKQKNYVDWKYENLKSIVKSPPRIKKGNGERIAYRFFTRQSSDLTDFYEKFYKNSKKILPENLQIDPLSLAVWFMDDGSRSRNTYYLNTQQFNIDVQKQLIEKLKSDYGICCSLNKDKQYARIRISQNSANRFRKLILQYIIPSMRYKIENNPVET